jgi:pilus assembly protein Flp/PilA
MLKLTNAVRRFWTSDEALTTVEYAIAGGLVGLAVVGAFIALGGKVGGVINAIVAILPA